MRAWWLVACCIACTKPAPRPAPLAGHVEVVREDAAVEEPFPCEPVDRTDIALEGVKSLVLISCDEGVPPEADTWERSAMLVHRTAGHTTSTYDLGAWSQTRRRRCRPRRTGQRGCWLAG